MNCAWRAVRIMPWHGTLLTLKSARRGPIVYKARAQWAACTSEFAVACVCVFAMCVPYACMGHQRRRSIIHRVDRFFSQFRKLNKWHAWATVRYGQTISWSNISSDRSCVLCHFKMPLWRTREKLQFSENLKVNGTRNISANDEKISRIGRMIETR